MFRNLLPKLASQFHVVAPDYIWIWPKAGMPDRGQFCIPRFENQTNFRGRSGKASEDYEIHPLSDGLWSSDWFTALALRNPQAVAGMIIQNGKRLRGWPSGILGFPLKKYWHDRSAGK